MTMCNNCIHKIVCSKYIATGGVKSCEHHKEERKGRWILREDGYHCSNCDIQAIYTGVELKYCPNCGADMRGNAE